MVCLWNQRPKYLNQQVTRVHLTLCGQSLAKVAWPREGILSLGPPSLPSPFPFPHLFPYKEGRMSGLLPRVQAGQGLKGGDDRRD